MTKKNKNKALLPATSGPEGTRRKRLLRQIRFLDYYQKSGFNVSVACRKISVNRRTFYSWRDNDKGVGEGHVDSEGKSITFAELLHEKEEEMKDFLEGKVYERVRRNDSLVTIFVAKTKLKDRGFDERKPATENETELMTKEQADAVVRAYRIRKGDTIIEGVEGPVKQVKEFMKPDNPDDNDGPETISP